MTLAALDQGQPPPIKAPYAELRISLISQHSTLGVRHLPIAERNSAHESAMA